MKIARAYYFLVLSGLCALGQAKRKKCDENEYYYYNTHLGCQLCDECPIGQEPNWENGSVKKDPRFGATSCIGCVECPPGRFNEKEGYDRCKRCTTCAELNRLTATNCSLYGNSECGECEPGYYDVYRPIVKDWKTKPCRPCEFAPDSVEECKVTSKVGLAATGPGSTVTPNGISSASHYSPTVNKSAAVQTHHGDHPSSNIAAILVPVICVCSVIGLFIFVLYYVVKHKRNSNFITTASQDSEKGKKPLAQEINTLTDVESDYNSKSSLLDGSDRSPFTDIHIANRASTRSTLIDIDTDGGEDNEESHGNLDTQKNNKDGSDYTQYRDYRITNSASKGPTQGDIDTDGGEESNDKLDKQKNNEVSPKHMLFVQTESVNHKDLGRLLDLKENKIEELEKDFISSKERIYQTLLTWTRMYHTDATVGKLYKVLKTMNRKDVAENLLDVPGN